MSHSIKTVRFTLNEPIKFGTQLLFGMPPSTREQSVLKIIVSGADQTEELIALNSGQTALTMTSLKNSTPTIDITFAEENAEFPDWIFQTTGGAHETPSAELIKLVADIAPIELSQAQRVEKIVRHVEERFTYGIREVGLGDDAQTMPALDCDIHLGTCVDTHSYAVAAMRAVGIPAAYVSGIFFHQGSQTSEPSHCWFVIDAPDAPHHWDISHYLKYNLGPVQPVFNPKPGIRFALSIGRDLIFQTETGKVTFSRLSGFHLLSGSESGRKIATRATIL